jgi:hypothetical protein
MDAGRWWMNIGGVTIWIAADRDGRPRNVAITGPAVHDIRASADALIIQEVHRRR